MLLLRATGNVTLPSQRSLAHNIFREEFPQIMTTAREFLFHILLSHFFLTTYSFEIAFHQRQSTIYQHTKKRSTVTMSAKPKICIAGGGNAAHVLAALLPSEGYETTIFAPFQDQARQISDGVASQDGCMIADFASHNVPSGRVKGKVSKISKDAGDVIPEADVVFMPLPSFAYPSMLESLKPHLRSNQIICVSPGQGGFDWFAKKILGDELLSEIVVCGLMPMPFNCRIEIFGKLVKVQELKRKYSIGVLPHTAFSRCRDLIQDMFQATSVEPAGKGTMLECTLWPINAVIHPARLYTLLKDWKQGDLLDSNPLFYEDFTSEAAEMMDSINRDVVAVGKGLQSEGVPVGAIPHIFDWLAVHVYDEPKESNLQQFFTTSSAYKGFRCPLIGDDSKGYVPDFANRYFTEDISLGLCGYKGLAEIVGVETPTFDLIISWAQGYMGKEFLVGNSLKGKDLGETNAPQNFGLNTIQDLKTLYEK